MAPSKIIQGAEVIACSPMSVISTDTINNSEITMEKTAGAPVCHSSADRDTSNEEKINFYSQPASNNGSMTSDVGSLGSSGEISPSGTEQSDDSTVEYLESMIVKLATKAPSGSQLSQKPKPTKMDIPIEDIPEENRLTVIHVIDQSRVQDVVVDGRQFQRFKPKKPVDRNIPFLLRPKTAKECRLTEEEKKNKMKIFGY